MSKNPRHVYYNEAEAESEPTRECKSNPRLAHSSQIKDTIVGPSGDYQYTTDTTIYTLRPVMKNNSGHNSPKDTLDNDLYGLNDNYMEKLNLVRKKLNLIEISDDQNCLENDDACSKSSKVSTVHGQSTSDNDDVTPRSSTINQYYNIYQLNYISQSIETSNANYTELDTYYEISDKHMKKKGARSWSVDLESNTELNTIFEVSSNIEKESNVSEYLQLTYDPPKKKICKRIKTPVISSKTEEHVELPYRIRVGMDENLLKQNSRHYLESKCTQYCGSDTVDTDAIQSILDIDKKVEETQIEIDGQSPRSDSGPHSRSGTSCSSLINDDKASVRSSTPVHLMPVVIIKNNNLKEFSDTPSSCSRTTTASSCRRSVCFTPILNDQVEKNLPLDLQNLSCSSLSSPSRRSYTRDKTPVTTNTHEMVIRKSKTLIIRSNSSCSRKSQSLEKTSPSILKDNGDATTRKQEELVNSASSCASKSSARKESFDIDKPDEAICPKSPQDFITLNTPIEESMENISFVSHTTTIKKSKKSRTREPDHVSSKASSKSIEKSPSGKSAEINLKEDTDTEITRRILSWKTEKCSNASLSRLSSISSNLKSTDRTYKEETDNESTQYILHCKKGDSSQESGSGRSSIFSKLSHSTKSTKSKRSKKTMNQYKNEEALLTSSLEVPKLFVSKYKFPSIAYMTRYFGQTSPKNLQKESSQLTNSVYDSNIEIDSKMTNRNSGDSFKEIAAQVLEESKFQIADKKLLKEKESTLTAASQRSQITENHYNLRKKQSLELDFYSINLCSIQPETVDHNDMQIQAVDGGLQYYEGSAIHSEDYHDEIIVQDEQSIEELPPQEELRPRSQSKDDSDSDSGATCSKCSCFSALFASRETQFFA